MISCSGSNEENYFEKFSYNFLPLNTCRKMDSNKKGLPIWRSEYVQVYVSCTLFTRCGTLLWLFWGKACINYLCTLFARYSLFHEWFVTFTNRIWFDLWMVQLWNSMVQFEGVVACFGVCINLQDAKFCNWHIV